MAPLETRLGRKIRQLLWPAVAETDIGLRQKDAPATSVRHLPALEAFLEKSDFDGFGPWSAIRS